MFMNATIHFKHFRGLLIEILQNSNNIIQNVS